MSRSTIPAGRWLGVDLRVHMALPALLLVAGAASLLETGAAARGISLWCALLLAVLTREGARALALVWTGRPPRGIVLFPFGGVVLLSPPLVAPEPCSPSRSFAIAQMVQIVPLLANFAAAGLFAAFSYAVAPGIHLLAPPWISLHHLLRSTVWTQAIIGAVNLLPPATLPSRQLLRSRAAVPTLTSRTAGPSFGLLNSFGLLLMLLGFVLMNLWFIALGCMLLLSAQLSGNALGMAASGSAPELDQLACLPVRDVMVTGYPTVANSDILSEALEATARSRQEAFPVLQGDRLVGLITRATMARRLRSEGDGYVQRDMQRHLSPATPDEPVAGALRRAAALGAGEVVPVADDLGRVLGILTPEGVATAMQKRRTSADRPRQQVSTILTPAPSPAAGADAPPAGESPHP